MVREWIGAEMARADSTITSPVVCCVHSLRKKHLIGTILLSLVSDCDSELKWNLSDIKKKH